MKGTIWNTRTSSQSNLHRQARAQKTTFVLVCILQLYLCCLFLSFSCVFLGGKCLCYLCARVLARLYICVFLFACSCARHCFCFVVFVFLCTVACVLVFVFVFPCAVAPVFGRGSRPPREPQRRHHDCSVQTCTER